MSKELAQPLEQDKQGSGQPLRIAPDHVQRSPTGIPCSILSCDRSPGERIPAHADQRARVHDVTLVGTPGRQEEALRISAGVRRPRGRLPHLNKER